MFNLSNKKIQLFIFSILLVVCLIFCNYVETKYTKKATVIQVIDEIVIVQDFNGNVWKCYADGYCTGDKVLLTMDNNHTDNNINDDIIKKIKLIK